MREFFHGWRRKMGVATLVMACLIMSLWLRSQFRGDILHIFKDSTRIRISSLHGGFECYRVIVTDESTSPLRYGFSSDKLNSNTNLCSFWDGTSFQWKYQWPGFRIGAGQDADFITEQLIMHYFLLVIPLTLLSAYLFISKPQMKVNQTDDARNPVQTFPTR